MMICSKIKKLGAKTVCLTDEFAGSDGASQSLTDTHPSANAIISTGNANQLIALPPMEKIIGDLKVIRNLTGGYSKSLKSDGSLEIELQSIIGATNQLGFEKLSAREV
jgi:glycine reductase